MNLVPCISCGGAFPEVEGPTHRYMESSPGCWACFGEVLAREYSDVHYWKMHRLTVDSYAVQHPGQPSPQTIQSVAIHLMSICAILERGIDMQQTTKILDTATKQKAKIEWLKPPASMGEITVADVRQAKNAPEHARLVQDWAKSAWDAWSDYHKKIRTWLSDQPTAV